jgi:hypothetical protein
MGRAGSRRISPSCRGAKLGFVYRPTGGVCERDQATYADPHRSSCARTTVIVNGTAVVENANHTGATPGLVLRRGADGRVSWVHSEWTTSDIRIKGNHARSS